MQISIILCNMKSCQLPAGEGGLENPEGSPLIDRARSHVISFPQLARDETVFSLLSRACYLGGFPTATAASVAFLGNTKAGLLFDFPARLSHLSGLMRGRLSEPSILARDGTVLPFYTRFRVDTVANRAIAMMCGDSVATLKHDLGLRASAAGTQFAVKACPECLAEDTHEHGVAYWHRAQQLPGVTVCPKHGIWLLKSRAVGQGKQRTFLLPSQIAWERQPADDRAQKLQSRARKFAHLAVAALESDLPGGFDAEVLYYTYRHGLKACGYLSAGGRLRLESLHNFFRDHLAITPDRIRLCRSDVSRETDALIDVLRSKRRTHNTLPHLVLVDSLFDSWEHFSQTYEWERAMNLPRDFRSGYSEASTKRATDTIGNTTRTRPDRSNGCISVITSYMRNNPDVTRSQLVNACGASWRWLYRNNRTWLDANAPAPLPRTRRYSSWVDWNKRDSVLLSLIEHEYRSISFSRGGRVTPTTILRKLGAMPFAIQLRKMPRSANALRQIADRIANQRLKSVDPR